jgi:hypothetical protein
MQKKSAAAWAAKPSEKFFEHLGPELPVPESLDLLIDFF